MSGSILTDRHLSLTLILNTSRIVASSCFAVIPLWRASGQ